MTTRKQAGQCQPDRMFLAEYNTVGGLDYPAKFRDVPDYIRYDSDRLHTTYVAVVIRSSGESEIDERQVGFQLLRRLRERQIRVRDLEALDQPTAAERAEADRLRLDLERDESFVEYLIETARELGISSWIQ